MNTFVVLIAKISMGVFLLSQSTQAAPSESSTQASTVVESASGSASEVIRPIINDYTLVSQDNCGVLHSGKMGQCKLDLIEIGENRNLLPFLPFQTEIKFKRSDSCGKSKRVGSSSLLRLEIDSVHGKFIKYEGMDYLNDVRKIIYLPENEAIGTVKIEPINRLSFSDGQFDRNCRISFSVSLNVLAVKSKKDAVKVRRDLKIKLTKLKDQYKLLESLDAIKSDYGLIKSSSDKLFSYTSGLSGFDTDRIKAIVDDDTGLFGEDVKDLMGDILESILLEKQRQSAQPKNRFLEFFRSGPFKAIDETVKKIAERVKKERVAEAKQQYAQMLSQYVLAKEALKDFYDVAREKLILEEELQNILDEEINDAGGILARINARANL